MSPRSRSCVPFLFIEGIAGGDAGPGPRQPRTGRGVSVGPDYNGLRWVGALLQRIAAATRLQTRARYLPSVSCGWVVSRTQNVSVSGSSQQTVPVEPQWP